MVAENCSQCGAAAAAEARFCQDCGLNIKGADAQAPAVAPDEQSFRKDEDASTHDAVDRFRIVLGDACPICRAVSQLTFTRDRPPQIPIAGCREENGCRCSLPKDSPEPVLEATHSQMEAQPDDRECVLTECWRSAHPESEPVDLEPTSQPAVPQYEQSCMEQHQGDQRDQPNNCFPWPMFMKLGVALSTQAVRRGTAQSLLLISLDGAGRRPERPQVAEETALSLAKVAERVARSSDLMGLRSERCVAVLASDTAKEGAIILGRRIEEAWLSRTKSFDAVSRNDLAVGIASMPEAGSTFERMLERTEQALRTEIASRRRDVVPDCANVEVRSADLCVEAIQGANFPGDAEQRRGEGLEAATLAYQRGESTGVAISAQPNACVACCVAAEHAYVPDNVPILPVIGCTTPEDCQCYYAISGSVASQGPKWSPPVRYETLNIPRPLYEAAVFGIHPDGQCGAEHLAEYLDAYPLIPVVPDIEMLSNEVLFCRRKAQCGWEASVPSWAVVHGAALPLEGPLLDGIKSTAPPQSLPHDTVPYRRSGVMYITNWRVMFEVDGVQQSLKLQDISSIEWFPDSLACVLANRQQRAFFFVPNALQVGLILTRAQRNMRGA
jgi:hypothetical protein